MSFTCHTIDGGRMNDGKPYKPCNNTAVQMGRHSACCAENDLCLTNGLCQNAGNNQQGANNYWRDSCTDGSFQDPACPRFCKDTAPTGNAIIFSCPAPNTWCCAIPGTLLDRKVNQDCCQYPNLTFTAPSAQVYTTIGLSLNPVSTTSSTMTTIMSSGSSISPSPSTSTALPSRESTESDSTAKVGLAVGLTLGLALLIASTIIIILLLRKRKNRDKDQTTQETVNTAGTGYHTGVELAGTNRVEAPQTLPEVPGKEMFFEMYGDGRHGPLHELWDPTTTFQTQHGRSYNHSSR